MTVVIAQGQQGLDASLREVLDASLADIAIDRGVFLKPNIVFPARPESGQVTPPSFVAAFVRVLRERHPGVDIVMGDGVAVGRDAAENFEISGYARLASDLGIPLVDLHQVERRTCPWAHGELQVPALALDRVYVNLPILKYSSACIVSGAMKNQKGLLLPAVKKQFHKLGLHEPIAQLNAAIRPALTVMDGSRFFGTGVVIGGDNCGEIDATVCRLLEIHEPEHLRIARDLGLFSPDFTVLGDDNAIQRVAPRPDSHESKTLGRLRLWSNPQACTGCRAVFFDAKADAMLPRNLRGKWKLAVHAVRGAELVMGMNPRWRREHDTVICVGNCTRQLADDNGYAFIPGCPPSLQDLYDHLP